MTEHDMGTLEIVARLVVGILLIVANAIFVLTEFALTRARQLGRGKFSGSAALRRAWKMTEELEIYLTGCQLGISTTSVLLGVIAEPGVTQLILPLGELIGLEGGTLRVTSVIVSIVLLNLVHKIWGEQAPTYFGVEAPVTAAKLGAPILYAWTRGLYPLVMAGDGIAKWTLRLFGVTVTRSWVHDGDADEATSQPLGRRSRSSYGELRKVFNQMMIEHRIPSDRRQEVIGALEIDLVPVRDVMVP
ncbi:MAG: CNNM domain-containing protein, partial [Polyangiaceae bacterium]